MPSDRREMLRVPDVRLITQIAFDCPGVASIMNVSTSGIRIVKPLSGELSRLRTVQLEIPIPEASESIWALGEVMFERVSFQGIRTGIRFVSMANRHQRILRDLVEMRKQDVIANLLREAKYPKKLTAQPPPFLRPCDPLTEDTIRTYLMPVMD